MFVVAILSFAGAKVLLFFEPTKYLNDFFSKKVILRDVTTPAL